MEEIWRDIKGYEGLYQVSNFGRVKSLNYNRTGKEKILKPGKNKLGYLRVCLYKNNKYKSHLVHRLVAQVFLENPENKPCINHIDCNPSNNNVNNLEWVTQRENIQYASKLGRMKGTKSRLNKHCCKPIVATNIKTGEQICFKSTKEAANVLKTYATNIYYVLSGKYKQHKGFIFTYM